MLMLMPKEEENTILPKISVAATCSNEINATVEGLLKLRVRNQPRMSFQSIRYEERLLGNVLSRTESFLDPDFFIVMYMIPGATFSSI